MSDIRKLLNEVRDNYAVPNPDGLGLLIGDEYEDELNAMILKLIKGQGNKAVLGFIEYLDQIPTNEGMDWKALLADSRKLIEAELKLKGEKI